MKQHNVSIAITGIQHSPAEEKIKQLYTGQYTAISGNHIIKYNEYPDTLHASGQITKTLLKISRDAVHITKKGVVNTRMDFSEGKIHRDIYQTPLGTFDLTLETKKLTIQTRQNAIYVLIAYLLQLNGCPSFPCNIEIKINGLP